MSEISLKDALLLGVKAHQAGDFDQADVFYSAILRAFPNSASANHNMGVLALSIGKRDSALSYFERSIEADPSVELYWFSYVNALIKLGKIEFAKEILDKATASALTKMSISKLKEILLKEDKRREQDIPKEKIDYLSNLYKQHHYDSLLKKAAMLAEEFPKDFRVWNFLGAAYNKINRSNEAFKAFKKVTELNPHFAEGFNNLGATLRQQSKQDYAIRAFKRALALKPDFVAALMNMGNVHNDQGKYKEAIVAYKKALSLKNDDAKAFHQLAVTLFRQGSAEEALKAYGQALELSPDYPECYNNSGIIFQHQGNLDKAIHAYKKAISIKPEYTDAHNNMGVALKEQGKLKEAGIAYEKAASLQPDHADTLDNMGRLHWLRRDFVRAFELMEWRWKKKQGLIGIKLSSNKPAWSGDVKSKVFVWKEQGIGDEIMFSSILLDADRKSKKLIVECDKRLIPLYRRSFPKRIKFIGDRKIISESEYESQIAIGSLPLAFRRELRDFSDASSGWLKADTRKVKGLRKKLEAKPNEKVIGITWFTNASDPRSKRRNIPVDLFSKYLTQIPAKYVNLQYGETDEDLSKMRSKFALDVSQVDSLDLFNDLDGLAALISACDIVISIDNATVHFAGALGVDTRVLLPFAPDDRWGINQKDSYWYDSLTLYRQEIQGDWQKPFETLKKDVTSMSF